jgi:hypothetical protein
MNRKPKRLSFDTTYSHGKIYDWLKTILTDWTIIIPSNSCSEFALSNWPATGLTRNVVKQWLEEKNHQKPDDLIDGACEPLAYYLSSTILQLYLSSIIELSADQESLQEIQQLCSPPSLRRYEEARKFRVSGIQAKEKQKHLERDRRIDGRIRKSFLEIDFL